MPTYEYRCSSCGERVEIVHSIHGGPPETCPNCGAKDTLRKTFAPPAIVFKGTGWAKKERSSRSTTRTDDTGSGSDDAKTGSTTETKGDATGAAKGSGAAKAGSGDSTSAAASTPKAEASG